MNIVTQEGTPVEDTPVERGEPTSEEDVRDIIKDIQKGLRRFRNSAIIQFGVVLVALRVVNVAGAIVIENQRLKAKQKKQDEEQK